MTGSGFFGFFGALSELCSSPIRQRRLRGDVSLGVSFAAAGFEVSGFLDTGFLGVGVFEASFLGVSFLGAVFGGSFFGAVDDGREVGACVGVERRILTVGVIFRLTSGVDFGRLGAPSGSVRVKLVVLLVQPSRDDCLLRTFGVILPV